MESLLASVAVGAGMLAAAVFSPFGGISDSINTRIHSVSDRNVIGRSMASSTPDIACISAAVDAREEALGDGSGVFTKAIDSAYSARATALHSAYTQSGTEAIRKAVEAAWKSFTSATKEAQKTWRAAQHTAWKEFNIAARACKAPSSVSDSRRSSSEVRGE